MRRSSQSAGSVLVLGTGLTVLGTLRALARSGIPAYALPDVDPMVRRSRWYRPAPTLPTGITPASLSDALTRLPNGTTVMPCSDGWALAMAGLPDPLRSRYPVSQAPLEVLENLIDKTQLARTLAEQGLPGPRTVAPIDRATLRTLPEEALTGAFLKPADSQTFFARFGVKAFAVRGLDDASERLAQCESAGLSMLLQEYVPGPASQHYYIEGFRDRGGVFRAWFARRRLRMYPADFGNSTLMVSVPLEEVADGQDALRRLLSAVGYRGIFSAEWKRDPRSGELKLLEINCRPWWFVEFAVRCGVNVCALAVQDAREMAVPDIAGYEVGRRCVYPYYDYFALRASRRLLRGMVEWVGAEPPVFRWLDPAPALAGLAGRLTRRLR